MILTSEQREAVKYDNNCLITACPGSGKTRTLVAKLILCLNEVRETPRKIACVTYTNSAVYEIENRLKIYGKTGDEDYCEIATIHSFCLSNILQYFYWKIPEYKDGFKVLSPDNSDFERIIKLTNGSENINKVKEDFERLCRNPNGNPIIPFGSPITTELALKFWSNLQKEKYIDFSNIIYYSYYLLNNFSFIANAIACKFAWFLIDEFQDTTSLQVEIFKKIFYFNKTKFFLVGDPFQSIYGFTGARPDLMDNFAQGINAKQDFKLLLNFRSNESIIKHAEILFPRNPPMKGSGIRKVQTEPMYIHCTTAFEAIVDYFIPTIDKFNIQFGDCAILAPWWIKLFWLGRQLKEYGIPIIGPGSRPYKKSHLIAPLIENICSYIEYPNSKTLYKIEKELFNLINNVTGSANFKVYSYHGRAIIYRIINCGIKISQSETNAMLWLKKAIENFADILIESEFLPLSAKQLMTESAEEIKRDIEEKKIDLNNLSIYDIGIFANPDKNIKLLTMHGAKGREFEAVSIIDLHEGRVPHWSTKTSEQIEESKRLFYVSITRSKSFLMYVTDTEDWRNKPCRFLCEEGLDLI